MGTALLFSFVILVPGISVSTVDVALSADDLAYGVRSADSDDEYQSTRPSFVDLEAEVLQRRGDPSRGGPHAAEAALVEAAEAGPVQQLVDMGFDRAAAERALEEHGNDVMRALNRLLNTPRTPDPPARFSHPLESSRPLESQTERQAREGPNAANVPIRSGALERMIGRHSPTKLSYLFLAAVLQIDGHDINALAGYDFTLLNGDGKNYPALWAQFVQAVRDYAGMNGGPAQRDAQPGNLVGASSYDERRGLVTLNHDQIETHTAADGTPAIPFNQDWHVDTRWQNRLMGGGVEGGYTQVRNNLRLIHDRIRVMTTRMA